MMTFGWAAYRQDGEDALAVPRGRRAAIRAEDHSRRVGTKCGVRRSGARTPIASPRRLSGAPRPRRPSTSDRALYESSRRAPRRFDDDKPGQAHGRSQRAIASRNLLNLRRLRGRWVSFADALALRELLAAAAPNAMSARRCVAFRDT
jgi:hypothetical protein